MNTKSIGFGLFALLVSAAGAVGCTSGSNANLGTLKQSWTIAGAKNPALCEAVGAVQMRLVVVDAQNAVQATQFTSCSLFQTELALPASTYTAAATFLDGNGQVVSKALVIAAFAIRDEEDTSQTIDFLLTDFITR